MKRSGGFRFARKAVTVCRWVLRRRGRINGLPLKGFLRRLNLLFDYKGDRANAVPKGHLAIHVGQPGHETCRVIVPVACINHSLFQELLDRVEPVYGYYHPGAINLPCSMPEYEAVRRSIAASENPDRAVLEQKKKMFALSYLRNSFSKILVHSIPEY